MENLDPPTRQSKVCSRINLGSTYPSPNQTFCPKWDIDVNVELGEG